MTLATRRTREFANDVTGMLSGLMVTAERLNAHQDAKVSADAQRILDASARISEMCQAEVRSHTDPHRHRGECIAHLLADIDAIITPERTEFAHPYALRLQILDEIDFDCCSPTLFRVLYNLVANAAGALKGISDARIDVFVTQHQGQLFVQVADNGPGLPSRTHDWFVGSTITQLLKGAYVGNGLASVAALLTRKNGELRLLYSGPEGTRFGISLPTSPNAPWSDEATSNLFAAMTAEAMWSHPYD